MQWWQVIICVGVGFNLGALTIQEIRNASDHRETRRQISALQRMIDHG